MEDSRMHLEIGQNALQREQQFLKPSVKKYAGDSQIAQQLSSSYLGTHGLIGFKKNSKTRTQ
jgi:hypothetical protein